MHMPKFLVNLCHMNAVQCHDGINDGNNKCFAIQKSDATLSSACLSVRSYLNTPCAIT